MSSSPARRVAREVVTRVRERSAYAHEFMDSALRTATLSPADAALATRLAYGTLQAEGTLIEAIERYLGGKRVEPRISDALRVSAYEILFLRSEKRAAVHQGVELVREVRKQAAGLANAVLRRLAEDAPSFPWGDPQTDVKALARLHAHPQWLADMWIAELGRETARAGDGCRQHSCSALPRDQHVRGRRRRSPGEAPIRRRASAGQASWLAASRSGIRERPCAGRRSNGGWSLPLTLARSWWSRLWTHGLGRRSSRSAPAAAPRHCCCRRPPSAEGGPAELYRGRLARVQGEAALREASLATACLESAYSSATLRTSRRSMVHRQPARSTPYWSMHRARVWERCADTPRSAGASSPTISTRWRHWGFGFSARRRVLSAAAVSWCTRPALSPRRRTRPSSVRFWTVKRGAHFLWTQSLGQVPEDWQHFVTDEGYFRSLPSVDGPDGHFAARLVRV